MPIRLHPLTAGLLAGTLGATLIGCTGSDTPAAGADVPAAAALARPTPASGAAAAPGAGMAQVVLAVGADTVRGEFPATLCGGPYIMGQGVAYQTKAGDWQITVASEAREQGDVALNTPGGDVSVVVTANRPGLQLVRGPRNGGTLRLTDDFRRAEADLELRALADAAPAHLTATFTCDAST